MIAAIALANDLTLVTNNTREFAAFRASSSRIGVSDSTEDEGAENRESSTFMSTMFDSILGALQKAADYNRDDTVPPAAVLWPDEKREWERLVPRLRATLPQFLTFGPYDAAHPLGSGDLAAVRAGRKDRRCADAERQIVPIIYLPGVSRTTLRATEDCPPGVEAAGRAAIPGRDLVAGQREGLDRRRLPPDRERRAEPDSRQGSGHGDIPAAGPGEAGRRPDRRTCRPSPRPGN